MGHVQKWSGGGGVAAPDGADESGAESKPTARFVRNGAIIAEPTREHIRAAPAERAAPFRSTSIDPIKT